MGKRISLSERMVCVHNKPSCRTIIFNKWTSERIAKEGFKYCDIYKGNDGYRYLRISNDSGGLNISFACKANATVSSKDTVDIICDEFKLGEGDFRFKMIESAHNNAILLHLTEVIHQTPFIRKENNSTKSVQFRTLSDYADQDLYNELKRRGYEGQMTITKTLM